MAKPSSPDIRFYQTNCTSCRVATPVLCYVVSYVVYIDSLELQKEAKRLRKEIMKTDKQKDKEKKVDKEETIG